MGIKLKYAAAVLAAAVSCSSAAAECDLAAISESTAAEVFRACRAGRRPGTRHLNSTLLTSTPSGRNTRMPRNGSAEPRITGARTRSISSGRFTSRERASRRA